MYRNVGKIFCKFRFEHRMEGNRIFLVSENTLSGGNRVALFEECQRLERNGNVFV
jgi:hypothetical protein